MALKQNADIMFPLISRLDHNFCGIKIIFARDTPYQVHICVMDLQKAFDIVNHVTLCNKLKL